MDIYVGNLSNEVTESDLQDQFGSYGDVASIIIMTATELSSVTVTTAPAQKNPRSALSVSWRALCQARKA